MSVFERGGFRTHDVPALLSEEIEDRDYRPLGCAPSDQGVGDHGAVRAMIVNAVLYLISLSCSLILKFG